MPMSSAAPADAHFDALETRSADEREAALRRALPAQIAHAIARAPALAARLRGVDPAAVTSRAALAALPVLRKSDLLARQNAGRCARPVRRLRDRRLGCVAAAGAARRPRLRLARADPRARDGACRLLAHGTGAVRGRLSRRRPRPQQLQLPPDARRIDDGKRRARDRLHGLACRHRADRAAAAGDGRARARRLCRNAELPAPAPREGRRDRRRRCRR